MIKLSELILDVYDDIQKEALSTGLLDRAYKAALPKVKKAHEAKEAAGFTPASQRAYRNANNQRENFFNRRMVNPRFANSSFSSLNLRAKDHSYVGKPLNL